MSTPLEHQEKTTMPLALALLPIVFLIASLGASVYFFGADASYGANQIALILAGCIAMLVGLKQGIDYEELQAGLTEGIHVGLGPILILLSVGMLIGTWILAGTVPAMIYYGIELINPSYFYATCAILCAVVAVSIGSSWTVAGTLGVGLIGIAGSFDLSLEITAGAIISGAYFGDKLSPLSDTTNLASAVTGVDLFQHIRHMLWTTIPAFVLACIAFFILGSKQGGTPTDIAALQGAINQQFQIGLHLLIPLVIMLTLIAKRIPAYPSIIISALIGGIFAAAFQADTAAALIEGSGDNISDVVVGIWSVLFNGFQADTGNAFLDKLLSKGGMSSMLNTVWLIVCALSFGGILERTGILDRLIAIALKCVRGLTSLVATTVATCFATNLLAADQFIAIALPGRMFKQAYRDQGLDELNLSRTLEDSGTLTSVLIPWNTCGAYMTATLGVASFSYAPYTFFNLLCPFIAIAFASRNIGQKHL